MRTVEIVSIFATLFGGFLSALAAVEQNLVKKFKASGAISKEKAVAIKQLRPLSRWRVKRLQQAGVIKEVEHGELYLDESAWRVLRTKRVWMVVAVIIVSVFIIIVFHN
jgi:hypothetical protein